MITANLIKDGIRAKIVEFVVDPNMERGTVCKIGDSWFYFGGQAAEELSPQEYVEQIPQDDIIREILETLNAFEEDGGEFLDEYEYYEAVLTYRNDM